jgi:hypothetical protein
MVSAAFAGNAAVNVAAAAIAATVGGILRVMTFSSFYSR